MKASVKYLIVLLITILFFSFSMNLQSRQTDLTSQKANQLAKSELLPVYYSNSPKKSTNTTVSSVSLYAGVFNFTLDQELYQQVLQINTIENIYDFVGLSFMNYYDSDETKDCFNTSITVDENVIDLTSDKVSDPCVIIPYYLDDHLDQKLEKIYVSSKLSELLDVKSGSQITIPTVQIPIGMHSDFATQGNHKIDCNTIVYTTKTIEFKIDEIVDYYNSLYNTDYVILVPYTMVDSLLKEYKSDEYSQYQSAVKVIYSKDGQIESTIGQLRSISNRIEISNYYLLVKDRFDSLLKENKLLNNILLILIPCIILFTAYSLKNYTKKEKRNAAVTVAICSILMLPIWNIFYAAKYMYSIIGILICSTLLYIVCSLPLFKN